MKEEGDKMSKKEDKKKNEGKKVKEVLLYEYDRISGCINQMNKVQMATSHKNIDI